MPIHRTIKNVVHNYTYAEVKVREATSNDPWGPSSALMAEIAELTNNPMAYGETMAMIWKRLNDHGKNWRHVYKSLVLLDYLIHHGSERVTRDCRTNIIAIRTLADFQHVDENGRDNGLAVREKARQLAILLGDDERLRGERLRAHDASERFGADSYGAYRDDTPHVDQRERRSSSSSAPRTHQYPPTSTTSYPLTTTTAYPQYRETSTSRPAASSNNDIDAVRPSDSGEEELQLQLALAMSKEEHEEDMKRRKADDMKLQLAIEESKKTAGISRSTSRSEPRVKKTEPTSFEMSSGTAKPPPYTPQKPAAALETMLIDPWASPPSNNAFGAMSASAGSGSAWGNVIEPGPSTTDPWSSPVYSEIRHDPAPPPSSLAPWEEVEAKLARDDAFATYANSSALSASSSSKFSKTASASAILSPPTDEFAALSVRSKTNGASTSPAHSGTTGGSAAGGVNLLDMSGDDDDLGILPIPTKADAKKVTPEEFLGPNAKLVDFDDLVSKPTPASVMNPFAMTIGKSPAAGNPFVARAKEEEQSRKVPINQLQTTGGSGQGFTPLAPQTVYPTLAVVYSPQTVPTVPPQQGYNPFL